MADDTATTIRVGSLCGRPVHDASDEPIGHVIDVRAVQDGPMRDGATASLRVDGLVIGHGGVAERLGLLRHRVHGPWLVLVLARILGKRAHYVPWDQVVEPHGLADPDIPVRFRGDWHDLEE